MKNKQNISVYLRKEIYDKYDYLSRKYQVPISNLIKQLIDNDTQLQDIFNMVVNNERIKWLK